MEDRKGRLSPPERQPDRAAVLRVLRALADPNRLRIFEQLMQGDSCNCELNEQLGMPPNLLSHHLRVLREAGLIRSRRDRVDSRWIYYSVNRETVAYWHSWFSWFLHPARIRKRAVLCGPEGMLTSPNGDGHCTRPVAETRASAMEKEHRGDESTDSDLQ
ncbi:MAG: metalloregulator ArsR/SmtB family transcription factor [Anaerolineae bacterium]|nr:metalloregulator ArsR/SmtB family transcription factor [Anaerolineae bacterium]MDW8072262.1 metalloregulator ArsR/SmtB family transcription factor [Anaerolineae bacterium]